MTLFMLGRGAGGLLRLVKSGRGHVYPAAGSAFPFSLNYDTVRQLRLAPELDRWASKANRIGPVEHCERKIHSRSTTFKSKDSSSSQSWDSSEPWGAPKREVKIGNQPNAGPVIYRGTFSETLRKVKLLSLSSCFLSVITGPVITFLTSPNLSVILKGGIASTVVILSASTTAALHWFAGPYVHRLIWKPGSQEIEVHVLSWMATIIRRTIRLADVRPPKTNRPFVSFSANGNFYFVDPEKFPNRELLRRLTFYGK